MRCAYNQTLDNIVEQISQILNDPGSMKYITQMAEAIGGSSQNGAVDQSSQSSITELSNAVCSVKAKEEKHQALIRALLPYLRPGHQQRLERAMQIAKISHFAEVALKTGAQHASSSEQEESDDV